MKNWFQKNGKKLFIALSIFVVLELVVLVARYSKPTPNLTYTNLKEVTYTEFLKLVDNGKVDTVYYSTYEEYMQFSIKNKDTKNMSLEKREKYTGYKKDDFRKCKYPAYKNFRKDMLKKDVNVIIDKSKTNTVNVLSIIINLAIPILWIVLIIKMVKGGGVPGASFNKETLIQESDVKFKEVIGQEEILDDIKFIVELIKNPSIGEEMGTRVPKGILLTGEPGVGKTLIAKAIAGEAGVPFISLSGSDFKEMFVGLGAKRVRETFKIARENSPCIIFIDEIDSVGSKRNAKYSSSEDDQTINALLKEMDGFTPTEGIFVLAATNHPNKLDKALVRAGRFDRQITVVPPRDWKVRKELFEFYLKDAKVSDDIDLDTLSKTVSGFTGADISMVCNEAGIIALMKDKKFIDNACLEEAIDKKIFKGNRSEREQYKKDKDIIAYHEAGHAVMSYLLNQPISRASIQSTTSGVGGAVFKQDKASFFTTSEEMLCDVKIAYAGRISESIKFGSITQGASNDIQQATEILREYVEDYGFDEKIGLINVPMLSEYNSELKTDSFNEIKRLASKLYDEAYLSLSKNYKYVEVLADRLLLSETLTGKEIKELFEELDSKES